VNSAPGAVQSRERCSSSHRLSSSTFSVLASSVRRLRSAARRDDSSARSRRHRSPASSSARARSTCICRRASASGVYGSNATMIHPMGPSNTPRIKPSPPRPRALPTTAPTPPNITSHARTTQQPGSTLISLCVHRLRSDPSAAACRTIANSIVARRRRSIYRHPRDRTRRATVPSRCHALDDTLNAPAGRRTRNTGTCANVRHGVIYWRGRDRCGARPRRCSRVLPALTKGRAVAPHIGAFLCAQVVTILFAMSYGMNAEVWSGIANARRWLNRFAG
jgi:hypothetical protein